MPWKPNKLRDGTNGKFAGNTDRITRIQPTLDGSAGGNIGRRQEIDHDAKKEARVRQRLADFAAQRLTPRLF